MYSINPAWNWTSYQDALFQWLFYTKTSIKKKKKLNLWQTSFLQILQQILAPELLTGLILVDITTCFLNTAGMKQETVSLSLFWATFGPKALLAFLRAIFPGVSSDFLLLCFSSLSSFRHTNPQKTTIRNTPLRRCPFLGGDTYLCSARSSTVQSYLVPETNLIFFL